MTPTGAVAPQELVDAATSSLELPCAGSPADERHRLTNAMLISWFSRPDWQQAFDLKTSQGRQGLRRSFFADRNGRSPLQLLRRASAALARGGDLAPGANLVGYAQGVLGMGEHVRMSAAAMAAANVPCGIVDFQLGLGDRRQRLDLSVPKLRRARHRCNIFHVNADQMPRTYRYLGPDFFGGRYNVGYWAWELSKWPSQWRAAIGTVDEIWAPSKFIQQALAPVTAKPVEWMPLCVELPAIERLPRSQFGIEAEDYTFLFTFDFHSYFERKNPLAAIAAFRKAFPGRAGVRLIVKAMNAQAFEEGWRRLAAEAQADPRILLINETWSRDRVLALLDACDAYISLHRSEGFGRGPAEAMLLGKPVIVTNYSGTSDFCRSDNSLLVDYKLVEVKDGSYAACAGQVWADPSVEQAAQHMRALVEDGTLGPRIGDKARQTISDEFSPTAIGTRYRERLLELRMI